MAASVWITSWIGPAMPGIVRPVAETIPVVSVWSRPNGLPIANTFWPTIKSALVPTRIFVSLLCAPRIRRTARSNSGAAPTKSASYVSWLLSVTFAPPVAPRMTWKLVTTSPASSQMNPDPVPSGMSTACMRMS